MFGLGMSEIIFLAVLALIVIGPKELPELARTIGRFMNELKRSTNVLSDELKQQTKIDRINFDEVITRPRNEEKPIKTAVPANNEPKQMEFGEQPAQDQSSDEGKKS